MIAFAARYGRQPVLALIGDLTMTRLISFSEALNELLEAENKRRTSRED